MIPITVITAVYGQAHVPFVGALLESLVRQPDLNVRVAHAGIGDSLSRIECYPNVKAVSVEWWSDVALSGCLDRSKRVALKTEVWSSVLHSHTPDGNIVFLDADTIMTGHYRLHHVFDLDFDVAYTHRFAPWPMNSGVVFARSSPLVREFFSQWADVTAALLSDSGIDLSTVRETTVSKWGALDQGAFMMVKELWSGKEPLKFISLDASVWNQEHCAPLHSAGIFHLKGCLPLLRGERDYGPQYGDERDPLQCDEVFSYWRWLEALNLSRSRGEVVL